MNRAARQAYSTTAPNGTVIEISRDVDATDPYRKLDTPDAIWDYYRRNGYVVCRGLVPPGLCDQAREAFAGEVKPYGGYVYRQATANPERHRFTEHGFVQNSILNVQDLNSGLFPEFKQRGLAVITHDNVQRAVEKLFGEPGKIVQSMYFEGNSATWPHQDTYYLDAERLGEMAGAWIAVEDISPGAGRFFVCPGSHKIDMQQNGGHFDIAFNHDRYKRLVIDIINDHGLPFHAPAMSTGDVLFWSSKTIHGSLETTQPEYSRASMTAHFIPESERFLQLQSRIKPLNLHRINGIHVHHPKSQDVLKNKIVLQIESRFPRTFQAVKKLGIKIVTR